MKHPSLTLAAVSALIFSTDAGAAPAAGEPIMSGSTWTIASVAFGLIVALIIFGMVKYPKSGLRRAGASFLIGSGGLALAYAFSELNSSPSPVISFLYVLGAVVSALALVIGIVKTIVAFSTVPKSRAARYAVIFAAGVGIAGLCLLLLIYAQGLGAQQPGQYDADRANLSTRLSLLAGLGICTAIFAIFAALLRDGRQTGHATEHYHGSARLATDEEINQLTIRQGSEREAGSFILAPPMPERGIKGQVILPRMQTTQHGLILGGTGTGKSRGYFLPNCAQSVGASLVVTDPKSELWNLTSGFQEHARRYAPADPDASEGFNWIPLCEDARMAELCARAIMQSGNTAYTDQFFIDTESAFLAALFAHASTMKEATPLTAYRLFTRQAPDDLIKQLLESPSETAREQAVIFMQTDPRYKGAIVPAVAARLQFMRDKAVQRFTSATLDAPDFGRLRREPTAIYWCLREQDIVRLRPLTSLFFTVLLEQLAGEQTAEGAGGVPVSLYLDEFANIGTIPDFETTISLARGRGVALWLGVQSLSQLDKSYGHANAQTIITNCSTKIALHGLDYNTAKYVSDMLGESTIVAKRGNVSFSPTGFVGVSTYGTEHRKMLMTPDEVMRLSETEAIIRTGNKYPMLVAKGYYDEPARTAPTSKLGEAITKDFPPLVMAGGTAANDAIDIL